MAKKTVSKNSSELKALIAASPTLGENKAVQKRLLEALKTMSTKQKNALEKLLTDEQERFDEIDANEIKKKTKLIDRTASKFKTLQVTQKRTSRKEAEAKERKGEEEFTKELLKKLDKLDRG